MANIDSMQQEAMRRVQAMQSKVPPRQNVRTPVPPPKRETQQTAPPEKEPVRPPVQERCQEPVEQEPVLPETSAGGTIDFLLKDKEQNLILLLIVLLAGDESDRGMLLALIYLLL